MQLNRDGVVMVLNENSEASFWINDEKLLFTLRNPSGGGQGWSVGDEVTYWTEESKRWGKGVISSLGESMAAVQGGVGDIHEVQYKNLKSPGMPVEALNLVEVELGGSENNDEKRDGGNGDKVEAKCSFEDVYNKNKSTKPTFVFPNPPKMNVDDDGKYNDGKAEEKVKSEDILAQSFPPSQPYAEHEFKSVSPEAPKLKTEEHLAMKHNLQKTSTGRFWHERWFRKRVSGKPKWPLFSSVNFFLLLLLSSLLFYQKEKCYGSEILNACMSNQKKMIYGKKSVTRPPLHIALCYNSR